MIFKELLTSAYLYEQRKRKRKPRRSQLDIVARILNAAQEATGKTQLMLKANLSFNQLKKYIEQLTQKEFIKRIHGNLYKTTEKGSQYLHQYMEFIKSEEKMKQSARIIEELIEEEVRIVGGQRKINITQELIINQKQLHYRQNRSPLQIIDHILKAAGDGSKKTKIMHQASLSHDRLRKYLAKVIHTDLLYQDPMTKGYQITNRGRQFIRAYLRLKELTQETDSKRQTLQSILNSI